MNKINDYLWISDLVKDEHYDEIPDEIDKVMNISGYQGMRCDLWYPLADGDNQQTRFDAAVHNLLKMIGEGNTVLVHCAAGVSRSAGLCIAVIMIIEDIEYEEAFMMVKEARNNINPNPEIVDQVKSTYIHSEFPSD